MALDRIKYLFTQYDAGKATEAERLELFALLDTYDDDDLPEYLAEELRHTTPLPWMDETRWQPVLDSILRPVSKRRIIYKWMAAAAACLLLAVAAYLYMRPEKSPVTIVQQKDVPPGSSRAILTLGDGSVVTLDSAGNERIQPGISRRGGELQYDRDASVVAYNTLTTPHGGDYRIVLPDGTKAWLNAGSSLRYPTKFTGNERQVEMEGEVYFEVAKQAEKFLVKIKDRAVVEVTGTHFNVNAYSDEPVLRTSLLEGRVSLNGNKLMPGEEGILHPDGRIITRKVDVYAAVAWKDGYFSFSDATLPAVMRQLARWYNVEVEFRGRVTNDVLFSGEIGRSLTLSQVLKGLSSTGVRFEIESGKRILIIP